MGLGIGYTKHPQAVVNPDGTTISLGIRSDTYESKAFSVTASEVDHSAKDNESMFGEVTTAQAVLIIFDKDVKLKFNTTSNDTISLKKTQSPWTSDVLSVTDIFVSGDGQNVNVQVVIV